MVLNNYRPLERFIKVDALNASLLHKTKIDYVFFQECIYYHKTWKLYIRLNGLACNNNTPNPIEARHGERLSSSVSSYVNRIQIKWKNIYVLPKGKWNPMFHWKRWQWLTERRRGGGWVKHQFLVMEFKINDFEEAGNIVLFFV